MRNLCEGHESLDGAHMGETVHCDGSCTPAGRRDLALVTADRLFVTRNSATAWRDEDKAMAHEHWGPFASVVEARGELVRRMNLEASWLQGGDRAAAIRDAAGYVEDDELTETEVAGLRWRISPYSS